MPFLFFFLLLLFPPSSSFSIPSYPFDTTFRIDCGGQTNFTTTNETWLSDRFYTGGAAALVSEPHRFSEPQQRTLRFFPISYGKKNCYIITDVPNGRYYFRTFTVYDNYDGKLHSPSFDVSVAGTVVFGWRSPWPEIAASDGAYSDLFAFVDDSEADICFYSIATDSPVVGSIEIVQIDPAAYNTSSLIGDDDDRVLLVNYGRLSCGGSESPGGYGRGDRFGRAWQSDVEFRADYPFLSSESAAKVLSTKTGIARANQPPNYFPEELYQTAVTVPGRGGGRTLGYELPVDAKVDYLVWLHFAEIDPSVTAAGKRVFDVHINRRNVSRIDIFREVGSFAAFDWHYIVKNLTSTFLSVELVPVVGDPLISGLENYALVPKDLGTVRDQVSAMRALKESLRVPARMGWNGDPCGPTSWDAWEGVTCRINEDRSALVVSQIELGSQSLKGYISEQISLLSSLVSLNLSSNLLEGTLPSGLGQKSLVRLDLSKNQFSGYIPDSLASSSLQIVLLNDNQLEGQVPEKLYSVGIHGGLIDLSGNKGLCGVPTLPQCPLFWGKYGLSTGSKVAIGLSCTVVFSVVLLTIFVYYIKKRRNDYDFDIPHNLISLAAKRNRYQRQKSSLVFEMETPNVNRFPTTLNPL